MIPWYWMIVAAILFGIGGFVLCAMFAANGRDDK